MIESKILLRETMTVIRMKDNVIGDTIVLLIQTILKYQIKKNKYTNMPPSLPRRDCLINKSST